MAGRVIYSELWYCTLCAAALLLIYLLPVIIRTNRKKIRKKIGKAISSDSGYAYLDEYKRNMKKKD